jgi:lauroyl/myristoyl acyltransferase
VNLGPRASRPPSDAEEEPSGREARVPRIFRRFLVRGVFWRQFLRWAVFNVPLWIEPVVIGLWSLIFLLWGPGRRGVMRNLEAIKPGSWPITNFFRCYRVFWNYAWTIADNVRFKELRTVPDWQFVGWEHFEAMEARSEGAILLTAHMGSYDLGAQIFSEVSARRFVMVRAPEIDPDTRAFEEDHAVAGMRVAFNTQASELAFNLLDEVRDGAIVAIQGDRVTPGISELQTTLFGKTIRLPAGPFALAMTARVQICPVFVIRLGRRRYQLLTTAPIELERTARNRDEDFRRAMALWTAELERVIAQYWYQWFAFYPFDEAAA